MVIFIRNRQMTSLTKPARIAGISRKGRCCIYLQNGKRQPIYSWCASQGPRGLPGRDWHERWCDHLGLSWPSGTSFSMLPSDDLSGERWEKCGWCGVWNSNLIDIDPALKEGTNQANNNQQAVNIESLQHNRPLRSPSAGITGPLLIRRKSSIPLFLMSFNKIV